MRLGRLTDNNFSLFSYDGKRDRSLTTGLSLSVIPLVDHAGLPPMRFHDLRHSCASLLLAQGVAPRVVMETLGHSRIAVSLDTYTHVLPALQREAADAMDRALRSDREP